ncbi:MAG: GIY-YIG nuclease family protein [Verrucomicrobiota bacterium]
MTPTPKTIQIFLPGGDPRGLRVAEITTGIVQVIEVPRSRLDEFARLPESGQVGVYFLFGSDYLGTPDEEDGLNVYVGQTGDLRKRLFEHDSKKPYWHRALVMVSLKNSLTQTHALFLEWHCLKLATEAGRYRVENGNAGSKPHTPAPLEADCLDIFETGSILLSTLGYPFFEPPARGYDLDEVFQCTAAGATGRGLLTDDGFVVLKGSVGRRANVPSIQGTPSERFRASLVETGVMREEGEKVIIEKDHLFGSPSMAAVALLGRSANGWESWKAKDGRTLDEVKRRAAPS